MQCLRHGQQGSRQILPPVRCAHGAKRADRGRRPYRHHPFYVHFAADLAGRIGGRQCCPCERRSHPRGIARPMHAKTTRTPQAEKSSKGAGPLIALAAVVLVVLAGGGYFLWSAMSDKPATIPVEQAPAPTSAAAPAPQSAPPAVDDTCGAAAGRVRSATRNGRGDAGDAHVGIHARAGCAAASRDHRQEGEGQGGGESGPRRTKKARSRREGTPLSARAGPCRSGGTTDCPTPAEARSGDGSLGKNEAGTE